MAALFLTSVKRNRDVTIMGNSYYRVTELVVTMMMGLRRLRMPDFYDSMRCSQRHGRRLRAIYTFTLQFNSLQTNS